MVESFPCGPGRAADFPGIIDRGSGAIQDGSKGFRWATWCPPCRAMIPHERKRVERLKDKPFTLVSISIDAQKDALTNFLKKEKMPWTHVWDGTKGSVVK